MLFVAQQFVGKLTEHQVDEEMGMEKLFFLISCLIVWKNSEPDK